MVSIDSDSARVILQVVPSLDETYGGPAVSVPSLAAAAEPYGYRSHFISVAPASRPGRNPLIDRSRWHEVEPSRRLRKGYYARDLRLTIERLIATQRPSALHVHSIWAYPTWAALDAARRHGLPLVVSPRSEFYPKSLRKSRGLKYVARPLFVNRLIREAAGFHATDVAEEQAIRALGVSGPILVSGNGVDLSIGDHLPSASEARRELGIDPSLDYMLFLSRIHERKRPDLFIEAAIESDLLHNNWGLIIAGRAENESLVSVLKATLRRHNLEDRVSWLGHVSGRAKQLAYASSTLFVLPSEFENFGNVIAEAMVCRVPVVTSPFTPWTHLPAAGAGWICGLTVAELSTAMREAGALRAEDRSRMGEAARTIALRYSWPDAGRDMATFYNTLIDDNAARRGST